MANDFIVVQVVKAQPSKSGEYQVLYGEGSVDTDGVYTEHSKPVPMEVWNKLGKKIKAFQIRI